MPRSPSPFPSSSPVAADRGRRRAPEEREHAEGATENTPLLPGDNAQVHADRSQPHHEVSARRSLQWVQGSKSKGRRRWPSILALLALCVAVVLIIVFAFLAPSTVESYAQQAVKFEPTSLSIASFTASGVRARIQGDFSMDASRVRRKPVRDLGRFLTYMAREAETGESDVEVSLPEYGNVVLGTAHVPGIKVDLRSGHTTHVDFLSDLEPGDKDGIRRVANDWIEGRLGELRVLGKAHVPVRSGIINLGRQSIAQEMLFANKDIPAIPKYELRKLNFRELELPPGGKGMAADVAVIVYNDYPVDFTVPPMAFNILVDACDKRDPYIKLADADTEELHIRPKQEVELNATGIVHQLPDLLIQDCPGTKQSPLDIILGRYMHGQDNTVYVRGSDAPPLHTPKWITDLISDITVPVPLPGKTFGHLIKNFSLTDTHFSLPDPFGDPSKPESNPRVSANIRALIALPKEMNFNLSVARVKADADIFYKGDKLGKLDLHRWQPASSSRVMGKEPMMVVESAIKNAPIYITDDSVFTDVIQALLFGDKDVMMHIKADVDVGVSTALGELSVRKIPAEGEVPVKPISRDHGPDDKPGLPSGFRPQISNLKIIDTSPTGLTLSALVNLTNPTKYSATVPYVDIHIMKNGSVLGHATARNLEISTGKNENLYVEAVYDPATMGGANASAIGRELISQYISGYNTSLTLALHETSIPSHPALGRALSNFPIEMPTPRLTSPAPPPPSPPGGKDPPPPPPGEDDGKPHFLSDATFHLLTSTATFLLHSPFNHEILYITHINATAYYQSEPTGKILYDLPFAVPPVGEDGKGVLSPRLPVDWSLGSVGYEAVKRALGGTLKLSAEAEVGVRVGRWEQEVWFKGKGIGAKVRI